jgi:hypothetical protein
VERFFTGSIEQLQERMSLLSSVIGFPPAV